MLKFNSKRSIRLRQPQSFYTTDVVFEVAIDDSVCDPSTLSYKTANGPATLKCSLPKGTLIVQILAANTPVSRFTRKPIHSTNLLNIAKSARQYYVPVGAALPIDIDDLEFLVQYEMGVLFALVDKDHLGQTIASSSQRHGESTVRTIEVFGYGLAIDYLANLLSINPEAFGFILDNSAAPDFEAEIPTSRFQGFVPLASNSVVTTITSTGYIVYLEVKARTGWAAYRCGEDGADLVKSLERKWSPRQSKGFFVGILVGLPTKSDDPSRTPIMNIADPGEPEPLSEEEHTAYLLKILMKDAERFGHWGLCLNLLSWLSTIEHLDERNRTRLNELQRRYSGNNASARTNWAAYRERRSDDGTVYLCRLFNEVQDRAQGGLLTREELLFAMDNNDYGRFFFAGPSIKLIRATEQRDKNALMSLIYGQDASSTPLYYVEESEATDARNEAVAQVLRKRV